MIIIGVDFHPEFQQIASVDTDTGEFQEKRLGHREEAEKYYRGLAAATDFLESYAQQYGTPETKQALTKMLIAYEKATRQMIVDRLVSYERTVNED